MDALDTIWGKIPMEPMDDFATLVKQMRRAQKRYFRERSPQTLNESKDLERRVDRALEAMVATPGLFPKEPGA